jgi:THO complex subunit 2
MSSSHLGLKVACPIQTHGVLLQYLELLTSPAIIPPEDYATKILPSLADLGELYGISAPICMQIIRPMLNSILLVNVRPAIVDRGLLIKN